jgi:hypothetical protein
MSKPLHSGALCIAHHILSAVLTAKLGKKVYASPTIALPKEYLLPYFAFLQAG